MPSDNNDIINRPFADLQERMAEVERLDRTDDITNRREVDYRAICNYLNSEIFHLIASVDDPKTQFGTQDVVVWDLVQDLQVVMPGRQKPPSSWL